MRISKSILPAFLAVAISLSVLTPAHAAEGDQQFADLGECKLESGEVIKDCRIGYRTFGTLNTDKSNAVVVLLPVWNERENSGLTLYNEARWLDPATHFVIVIDTLGNKVSIGPDNSKAQPGKKFPKASVRDMMEINRRLLKEELKLNKVNAIIGEQLGGMQALQWMIAYPDEMEKVVTIAATPKADVWDYMSWQSIADVLSQPRNTREDDARVAQSAGSMIMMLLAGPPSRNKAAVNSAGGPVSVMGYMQTYLPGYGLDRMALYARAIANHDAYKGYGDTAQKAVKRGKAKLLAFVLPDDQFTSTELMLEFAKLMNAKVVDLDKNLIESWVSDGDGLMIKKEIQTFLAK
jgi:homoserine O-acetyltransferase